MTSWASRWSKASSLALLVVIVASVAACSFMSDFMSETERNTFVTRFLESVRDDTAYYHKYLLERDAQHAEAARSALRQGFTIKGWSGPFGPDECYVEIHDGSTIVLYVIQAQRTVKEVSMVVYQRSAG